MIKKTFLIPLIVLVLTLIGWIFYIRNIKQPKNVQPPVSNNPIVQVNNSSSTTSKGNVPSIPLTLPSGYVIHIFADNLGNPRDLQFTPEGTLLVSDPNAGIVYALVDKNNDGVSEEQKIIISGENRPHGLAFYNGKLFVAEVDKVVRYTWDETTLTATKEKVLFNLPENNDHNNRTIVFDNSGDMFVSVGSTCNVCNEASDLSATVVISNSDGVGPVIFATGLRNAAFIQVDPSSNELWGTEMGRDLLGDNIPPDEINIIRKGNNYGWPNCYGDKIPDLSFNPNASCQNTASPVIQIPAHSAPLGLLFINSSQFPNNWQGDLLVSYHGSWNRSIPTGYKVVHIKIDGNNYVSTEDFLTGFLPTNASSGSQSLGRPVDLTFDKNGNLFISDDKAGNVYIVQKNY